MRATTVTAQSQFHVNAESDPALELLPPCRFLLENGCPHSISFHNSHNDVFRQSCIRNATVTVLGFWSFASMSSHEFSSFSIQGEKACRLTQ